MLLVWKRGVEMIGRLLKEHALRILKDAATETVAPPKKAVRSIFSAIIRVGLDSQLSGITFCLQKSEALMREVQCSHSGRTLADLIQLGTA